MKTWIAFFASLYPRRWREEFGDEFDAVLDDVRPGWRVLANVLRGAVEMGVAEGTDWVKIAAAMAALGAIVALGLSFKVAQNYNSSAMVVFDSQTDPFRPASQEVLHQRATERANDLKEQILSTTSLSAMIKDPRLGLYEVVKRRETPSTDVIAQMRRDLRIQVQPGQSSSGPIVVSISFFYPDRGKAEAVVRRFASRFTEQNLNANQVQADVYRSFWGDLSSFAHTAPAPPGPPGVTAHVSLVNPPTLSPHNRLAFLAWGLLLGLVGAVAMRWPVGVVRLVGFATAGCLLAYTLSFLLPKRYTSTAEMMITPAEITEDPLANLPAVTPATEFLRQMEPKLSGSEGLAAIVKDPRLNLYPEERRTKPIEEIVRNMRDSDLRITPVNPALGALSAFRISFSYPDRFKAQQTVQALMSKFDEVYMNQAKSDISRMSFKRRAIWERKAGEVLDVLDTPDLPGTPIGPSRIAIAMGGLGVGLLLGVIMLWRRGPVAGILPPNSPGTPLPGTS